LTRRSHRSHVRAIHRDPQPGKTGASTRHPFVRTRNITRGRQPFVQRSAMELIKRQFWMVRRGMRRRSRCRSLVTKLFSLLLGVCTAGRSGRVFRLSTYHCSEHGSGRSGSVLIHAIAHHCTNTTRTHKSRETAVTQNSPSPKFRIDRFEVYLSVITVANKNGCFDSTGRTLGRPDKLGLAS